MAKEIKLPGGIRGIELAEGYANFLKTLEPGKTFDPNSINLNEQYARLRQKLGETPPELKGLTLEQLCKRSQDAIDHLEESYLNNKRNR